MNKKTLMWIIAVVVLLLVGSLVIIIVLNKTKKLETDIKIGEEDINTGSTDVNVENIDHSTIKESGDIDIIPTMSDTIESKDTAWCATFQLVWNDMINEVVKQDVVFTPQEEMAVNLNKSEFTKDMISDEYYYKKYGKKSLALKEEIEKGIKEKFNQESDILDDFNWSELDDPNNPDIDRYFFYTMLFKKFDFRKEFKVLDKGNFGKDKTNVSYFGIDETTDEIVGSQIYVLYYNSKDDFAILINTETDDEVIFCKNPQGLTFNEIYSNMNKKSSEYKGDRYFTEKDFFKVPNIEFNKKREYSEFEEKQFKTLGGEDAIIEKAMQSIKFSLNEKGGEIKSEAAIDMTVVSSAAIEEENVKEPRYFYLDDTFAMFLRENGKDKPYFASKIEDITKFQ